LRHSAPADPRVARHACRRAELLRLSEQIVVLGGVMAQVGNALTVNVALQEFVQPLPSTIVTLYVPATPTAMHCVPAVNPPGPVHE